MKKSRLFFIFFLPVFSFGQISETFSDGNFSENPIWIGSSERFTVNATQQLQSNASVTATSFLFTPSQAIDDATWECWVKIAYTTSSSNYASVYLVSDKADISAGCNGYFVQIGGTNDEVSLFVQEGTKKTKIIDGTDKRTDGNPVELRIRVTRDAQGNFTLYSKLATETDYVKEGSVQNQKIMSGSYFGLLVANTSTTGKDYFFDDIVVSGNKAIDQTAPQWTSLMMQQPNRLILDFSEAIDYTNGAYGVDKNIGNPSSQNISNDGKTIELTFDSEFETGRLYTLTIKGLTDLAGNPLTETQKTFGVVEKKEPGDLVFNEVMFENPANSVEYLEICNKSAKVLDVSGLVFTTRKTDGSLNAGHSIPAQTLIAPGGYLALCPDADSLRSSFYLPVESNILTVGWSALNNQSATLVLMNDANDTVYDEFTYNANWHHVLIKNPKGVALERIHPFLATQNQNSWHSAASELNYGTPGYQNSQYRELNVATEQKKNVWVEPECFSPDNDGTDDVCYIRYKTDIAGYVANVVILNAVGVKVHQLVSNALLATEGTLVWDGKTDKGNNANAGIYVLYFDIYNSETGQRRSWKLPIVVTSR